MGDSSNIIKLNNTDYYFSAAVAAGEVAPTYTPGSSDNISGDLLGLNFSAFGGITLLDSFFAPFNSCSFTLNLPSNGPEQESFRFRANNRNRFLFVLANADKHTALPGTLDNLSQIERATTVSFDGSITSMSNLGSPNGSFNMQAFDCDETYAALLKEKKIAQILPAVDNQKTVGENIADILKLAINSAEIDEDSFKACTEYFQEVHIYPADFSAYDAILFLLPFCLGKIENLDTQLFLYFSKVENKFYLVSPLEALANFTTSEVFYVKDQTGSASKENDFIKPTRGLYLPGNDIMSFNFYEPSFEDTSKNYCNIKYISTGNPYKVGDLGFINIITEIDNFSKTLLSKLNDKYNGEVKLNVPLDPSKIGNNSAVSYKVFKGPYEKEKLERMAKANLYSLFMFENLKLSFITKGQTYRTPGMFVEISRGTLGGEFDTKLLGNWFVTDIKHFIDSKGAYMNEIVCSKPFIVNRPSRDYTLNYNPNPLITGSRGQQLA